MTHCKHCAHGFLDDRFGIDIECVNGVLIDIDVATEGWERDVSYPPAPCQACETCNGSAHYGEVDCTACNSTGWKSGKNDCQNRLADWAAL